MFNTSCEIGGATRAGPPDIAKENVLLSKGRALLSDFSLARVVKEHDVGVGLNRGGIAQASPYRFPPETIRGSPTGPSNNVWQARVGCVSGVESSEDWRSVAGGGVKMVRSSTPRRMLLLRKIACPFNISAMQTCSRYSSPCRVCWPRRHKAVARKWLVATITTPNSEARSRSGRLGTC